jgi:hypothetical protein
MDARNMAESVHLKRGHVEDSRLLEQALESRLEARLSELRRDHIPLGQHEQTMKAAVASTQGKYDRSDRSRVRSSVEIDIRDIFQSLRKKKMTSVFPEPSENLPR